MKTRNKTPTGEQRSHYAGSGNDLLIPGGSLIDWVRRSLRRPLAQPSDDGYHCRPRRGAGVAERAGLENRCAFRGTEGSNPSLSASFNGPRGAARAAPGPSGWVGST